MKDDHFLSVENVVKSFGGVRAVSNVSFSLERGALLGIIGPNGAGKTTLINLITGFIKPDKGRILFKGMEITKLPPYKIAEKGIARTFQIVRPFLHLPAFKNLIVPLYSRRVRRLKGGGLGDRDNVAIDLLEEVGFERDSAVPFKAASSLPHGYLKRLELARCLALRPELLVLDELFSGMSMSEVAATVPIIEKLKDSGLTIIMVEHRLRELFRIADRVIVMNFGEKIAEGKPSEILENEIVKAAYLGAESA
ncbi:MAG: ABC transporter ATP-binding protein [Candidatus Bathyarchaeia archaeon]